MTPTAPGFLMVAMEPPPALEEEFNDWYDTEHVPERQAVDGFESATRFVCLAGWPRYLAYYDLRAHGVIDEPGYRAISGAHFSPWSKRILTRVQGLWRAHGEQVYADASRLGPLVRLVMIRLHGVHAAHEAQLVERLRGLVGGWAGEPRLKLLRDAAGAGGEYVALVALSDALPGGVQSLEVLGDFARQVDAVNVYAQYSGRVALPGLASCL